MVAYQVEELSSASSPKGPELNELRFTFETVGNRSSNDTQKSVSQVHCRELMRENMIETAPEKLCAGLSEVAAATTIQLPEDDGLRSQKPL